MPPKTPSNKSAASGSKKDGSKADSTPPSRPDPKYEEIRPLSENDKIRVRGVEGNEGRCLIENCNKVRAVQFAHVVPKSFGNDEEEMKKLEWYWNLSFRGLHVNTRWNICNLGSSIHYMFDQYFWTLIPEDEITNLYYYSLTRIDDETFRAHRNNFPNIPDKRDHKYRLVPISRSQMLPVAITRQNVHPLPEPPSPPNPNDFTTHAYPFNTLPQIISHIHPKFVIFRAGLAIKCYSSEVLIAPNPMLIKIYNIYNAWTAELPEEAEGFAVNLPPPPPPPNNDDPGDDNDSNKTGRRSVRTQSQGKGTKRPAPNQPETPTPASKVQASGSGKGKGRQHRFKRSPTATTLTKKSLEIHTDQIGEEEGWTDDAIQTWSEKCRPLPDAYQSALEQANSHHQIRV